MSSHFFIFSVIICLQAKCCSTVSLTEDLVDSCEKDNEFQCDVPDICSTKIKLDDIEDHEIGEDNIFMIESSPKETLSSREACALESAARNSELQVVMVRVGQLLDLQDNTTCQLYSRFRDSITFYHIDPIKFSLGTPLSGFFTSEKLAASMNKFVHTADALRVLIINRFGGFYADSDFVILKSLKKLKNVIASDQVSEGDKYDDNNRLLVGNSVTNALFHFSKGAPILELALEILEKVYQPQSWASGGPDVLQRSLLMLCGFGPDHPLRIPMTREEFSREKCGGISLLDYKSFFPFGWLNQSKLFDPKRRAAEWAEIFQHSYGVHFYHSSSQSAKSKGGSSLIRKPKFYGARKPAYLVLALAHCPVSYWSNEQF